MKIGELFEAYGCVRITGSGAINFHHPETDTWIGGANQVVHEHLYLSKLFPNYVTVVGDDETVANVCRFQQMGARVIHYSGLHDYLYPDVEDGSAEVIDATDLQFS